MKLCFQFIFFLLLCISNIGVSIQAEENDFYVYNQTDEILSSFSNYENANTFYNNNIDNYDNLILSYKDEVLKMEYGVVVFDTEEDIEYYSISNHRIDYFNANYAIDALFLYQNNDDVYFILNNEIGYTNKKHVSLMPYSNDLTVSSYEVKDNKLYHNIKTTYNHPYFSICNVLGTSPNYLKENIVYYSYDGLFFYDDFYQMSDDYRMNNRENAINENRYFNYYQYLSFKSKSNYTSDNINHYLEDKLGFVSRINNFVDDNKDNTNDYLQYSQLYKTGSLFIADQEIYNVNGLMLLSSALSESDYGKSKNSFINNNLYSMASYNSNVQRATSRYKTIDQCVHNFSSLTINSYFSNFRKDYYTGTYYGDKSSGLSSVYSLDPYYGEKCASFYYQIDSYYGFKDYDNYTIVYSDQPVIFYQDDDLNESLYTLNKNEIYFTVLQEYDNSYSVLLENNSIVYISKKDVEVLNSLQDNKEYTTVKIDFNGGHYNGYSFIELEVNNILNIDDIKPTLVGYDFLGYSIEDNTYTANYKQIESVIKYCNFDNELKEGSLFDLKDQSLLVTYTDRTSKLIPITSDILSYYFDGNNSYMEFEYSGFVLRHDYKLKENRDYIDEFYNLYQNHNFLDAKRYYQKENVDLDWDELRSIDKVYRERNDRNYIMADTTNADISISGLDLSLPDKKTFSLFEDSYYINTSGVTDSEIKKVKSIFEQYDFNIISSLNISFNFNYESIDLSNKAIVSMRIDNKKDNCIYSVYQISSNGLKKCKTEFSDHYVMFEMKEAGNYVVLEKDSFNQYSFIDHYENITKSDTGIDNNKINIEFLITIVLLITNFIGVIVFYLMSDRKEKRWKDFKKSLQTVDTVLEEKQKN